MKKKNSNEINSSLPSATYMHQWIGSALVQIMACRLFGAKSVSKPFLGNCLLEHWEQISVKIYSKYKTFHSRKCIRKHRLQNGGHFVPGADELAYGLIITATWKDVIEWPLNALISAEVMNLSLRVQSELANSLKANGILWHLQRMWDIPMITNQHDVLNNATGFDDGVRTLINHVSVTMFFQNIRNFDGINSRYISLFVLNNAFQMVGAFGHHTLLCIIHFCGQQCRDGYLSPG